jgi:hypothetical protein
MELKDLAVQARGRILDLTTDNNDERIEPLALDVFRTIRIEVSWGGPQEYFDVKFQKIGDRSDCWSVVSASFHFLDWTTHETYELSDDETDKLIEYFDLTEYGC